MIRFLLLVLQLGLALCRGQTAPCWFSLECCLGIFKPILVLWFCAEVSCVVVFDAFLTMVLRHKTTQITPSHGGAPELILG